MRTTLEIDDDVMREVRDLARLKNESIGRTLSAVARRGLLPDHTPIVRMEEGIPVWDVGPGAVPVTSELVRRLADDE